MDEITLILPGERDFFGVAHLVLAGLAARLDLSVEHLDDLQLALERLFHESDGKVSMTFRVEEDAVEAEVGPFPGRLSEQLARPSEEVDLRRVLDTVVDGFEVERRDGADWVTLRKAVRKSQ